MTTWAEFEEKFKPARFGSVTVNRDYMWVREKDGTDHIVLKDLGWMIDIEPPRNANYRVDDIKELVASLIKAVAYCKEVDSVVVA